MNDGILNPRSYAGLPISSMLFVHFTSNIFSWFTEPFSHAQGNFFKFFNQLSWNLWNGAGYYTTIACDLSFLCFFSTKKRNEVSVGRANLFFSLQQNVTIVAFLPFKIFFFIIKNKNKKTSTTPSCSGPILAQKSLGNSVLRVVSSHTMPKMIFHYSHRFSWEKTH